MIIEIVETPIRFHLYGIGGVVENERFAEVGLALMNQMWEVIRGARIATTGINHWVYLPRGRMFVGVELAGAPDSFTLDQLEPLEVDLPRFLRHVHIGPYQTLPRTWQALKAELAARGEVMGAPALEIYGHHTDDPSKLETTILIGLEPGRSG